jgi:hypothetical protein
VFCIGAYFTSAVLFTLIAVAVLSAWWFIPAVILAVVAWNMEGTY